MDPATVEKFFREGSFLAGQLALAFVLGVLVAILHAVSSRLNSRNPDRPFMTTILLLALLVALVTVVIGDNLARAFGLAGSLAIVRFRTVVEDTRDTAFVIYAVVAGMAAGAGGYFWIGPVLCAPMVLLTCILLRAPVTAPRDHGSLHLRIAAGRPPEPRIEELLRENTRSYGLAGVATARGGAAYDVLYHVQLTHPERFFVLVSELTRVEGVQSVELKDR